MQNTNGNTSTDNEPMTMLANLLMQRKLLMQSLIPCRPISAHFHGLLNRHRERKSYVSVLQVSDWYHTGIRVYTALLNSASNMTTRALAAKEQFHSECFVAGARKLEGKLKV